MFDWELCDSGDFFCPLWLSAGSISVGKARGCLKNEESNIALEEFAPLPSGWVCVSTCLYMIIVLLQSLKVERGGTLHFTFRTLFK